DSLHDVLHLVLLAAPAGAAISATLGVGSLLLGHVVAWPSVLETWKTWWLGDMISLLLLTPLLLTWRTWPQVRACLKRGLELLLMSVLLWGVGLFVFLGLPQPDQGGYPITYMFFPPLTWAALRFGPRGATAALVFLSSLAIVGTVEGVSPFS